MSSKTENQIIKDWLHAANREVRYKDTLTIVFISVTLNASLDNVWGAWTDPSRLSKWFAEITGEIKEGNEIAFDVGAPDNITSKIIQLKPQQKLRFTWSYPRRGTDEIEVRFTKEGNATLMELEQYSTDKSDWWYGAGSGWESAFVRLFLLLSGDDPKRISNEMFDHVLGPLWQQAGNLK